MGTSHKIDFMIHWSHLHVERQRVPHCPAGVPGALTPDTHPPSILQGGWCEPHVPGGKLRLGQSPKVPKANSWSAVESEPRLADSTCDFYFSFKKMLIEPWLFYPSFLSTPFRKDSQIHGKREQTEQSSKIASLVCTVRWLKDSIVCDYLPKNTQPLAGKESHFQSRDLFMSASQAMSVRRQQLEAFPRLALDLLPTGGETWEVAAVQRRTALCP